MKKLRVLALVAVVMLLASCSQTSVKRKDLVDALYNADQSATTPCQAKGSNTTTSSNGGTSTTAATTTTSGEPCNGIPLAVANCVADKLFADSVSQATRDDIGHATDISHLTDSEKKLVTDTITNCESAAGSTTTTSG